MNELKVFQNSEFGELGVLTIDGKEFFPATQCAKILGHENPARAIRKYCKGVTEMVTPTNGGNQATKFIPEGDLYRLIIRSKLPSAEKFERWVFDEVLPELRKNGSYGNNFNLEEVIAKTATAVVSEVLKQIIPTADNPTEQSQNVPKRKAKKYKHTQPSKIETLKPELKTKVDDMIASGEFSCQQIANFIMNNCDMYISQMSANRYKRMHFIVDDNFDSKLTMFEDII
ncbi:MAG: hypothetical protein BHV95_03275 [Clostridiales bacterium Nov_37_41]|jgi:BRO-like protein|nr:BRO family protein [Oscillospiraceae bacterium]OLA00354.1 MAG: hypothetical protein BHV95_03275 [Clostridiales bacterium Nov_37_41]